MAIRGAKLTFDGGKKIWEYKSFRGRKKPIRKTNKKSGDLFLFVFCFGDSKNVVLCRGAI